VEAIPWSLGGLEAAYSAGAVAGATCAVHHTVVVRGSISGSQKASWALVMAHSGKLADYQFGQEATAPDLARFGNQVWWFHVSPYGYVSHYYCVCIYVTTTIYHHTVYV
jgi:hypothetical protein